MNENEAIFFAQLHSQLRIINPVLKKEKLMCVEMIRNTTYVVVSMCYNSDSQKWGMKLVFSLFKLSCSDEAFENGLICSIGKQRVPFVLQLM